MDAHNPFRLAEREAAAGHHAPHLAGGRAVVGCQCRRADNLRAEVGPGGARLGERERDAERRHLLRDRFDEALDPPLGGVIQAEGGIGDLAALGRHLQDAAAALRTQVRQRRADDLYRADEVGVDLLPDLVVGQFLGGADQAVCRVVHHHVDAAQVSESLIHHVPYGGGVRHIETRHPKPLAALRLEVIESLDLAQGRGHAVAARQQAFGHQPPEAGRRASDEPSLAHGNAPARPAARVCP